jgi:4-amino-4-deoxy-L-arabinose transferase-like glycosyltransferase
MKEIGLRLRSLNLKGQVNRWRLALLIFTLGYAVLLLLYLVSMSIQWDEATHLNTGIMMLHGDFKSYLNDGPFYPPLYDLVTAGFFRIAGISLFNARLVSAVFAILSIWTLFEFVNHMYGPKVALVSSVLLAIMPGFVWLSRLSMIETMLLFFFSISMLLFYRWLRTNRTQYIVLSGVALGLGFLAKYQAIVGVLIIAISLLVLAHVQLKTRLRVFVWLVVLVAAFAVPWFLITFQVYASHTLNQWFYALQMGNPQKSVYSLQFPAPVFYLVAMTWPYGTYGFAPVSIFIYIFALIGLGLFVWRRKLEDKFLLAWFFSVYVFFTLIGNKDWRYIAGVFPVLAVAAANLMVFLFNKAERHVKTVKSNVRKKAKSKFITIFLLALISFSIGWNCVDTTLWMAYKNQRSLPVEVATNYASKMLGQNESMLVVGPFNLLSEDIVKFYLQANQRQNQVWQYPEQPVDTYQPDFNIAELVQLCQRNNAKYLLVPDEESPFPLFNTTMTMHTIYASLNDSGRFKFEKSFGNSPYRICVASFA